MKAVVILVSAGLLISCGVAGAPVPPELVGVTPTIEKQKRQHALEAERQATESAEQDPALGNQDIDLSPPQPVGIR
ncbi:MAG: hypothetical protein P0119_04380 [Nitrospira sp.]|nr:hypothetical protein [Nitrospira sp.]